MVAAELETRHLVDREAVIPAFLDLQVEHGEARRREQLGPERLRPGQDLPFRHGQPPQQRRQIPHPGPAAITRRAAWYVPLSVRTVTPSPDGCASHPSTCSRAWIVAPSAIAAFTWATMARSLAISPPWGW